MNLKAVCVGSYEEKKLIASCLVEKNNGPLKADVEKIPQKIRALRSSSGQRDKLKTCYGVWFVTRFGNNSFAVCTSESYPERHAFSLINNLKEKISAIQPDQLTESKAKSIIESFIPKYNDPKKFDKLTKANEEVQLLEGELNVGIKKLMGNKETLSQLDDKADQIKHFAKEFEKKADEIEKQACWKKWKLYIMAGSAVLLLVVIVIIILAVNMTPAKTST